MGEDHLFKSLEIVQHVSLLPSYIGKFSKGITEALNAKLLKFLPEHNGFVLAYSKPVVLQHAARIVSDSPNLHFDVEVKLYLFTPVVGARLYGTVSHISEDHVGCLVYDCFNASVKTKSLGITKGDSIFFRIASIDTVSGVVCIHGEEVTKDGSELCVSNGIDSPFLADHTDKTTRKHPRCSDSDSGILEEELHKSKKRRKNKSNGNSEGTKLEETSDVGELAPESPKKKHKKSKKSKSKKDC